MRSSKSNEHEQYKYSHSLTIYPVVLKLSLECMRHKTKEDLTPELELIASRRHQTWLHVEANAE